MEGPCCGTLPNAYPEAKVSVPRTDSSRQQHKLGRRGRSNLSKSGALAVGASASPQLWPQ